jgi:hypothetical protein
MICTLEVASSRTSPPSRPRQWRQQRRRQRHRVQDGVIKKYFNRDPTRQVFLFIFRKLGDFWSFFMYFIQHCFMGRPSDSTVSEDACWDRTQDCCDFGKWQSESILHFFSILLSLKNLRHFNYGGWATYVYVYVNFFKVRY